MTLFCVAIWRDSVSLFRFPFLSHDQVFWWEISLVYRLKYPYNRFSFHFCFLVIVVLLILLLFVLFLVGVISLSLFFLWSLQVVVSMHRHWRILFNADISSSFFFSWRKSPCNNWGVMFYALSFVFLFSAPFVEVLPSSTLTWSRVSYERTAPVLILLVRFLLYSLVSSSFLVLLRYSFLIIPFISACLMVAASNISKYL